MKEALILQEHEAMRQLLEQLHVYFQQATGKHFVLTVVATLQEARALFKQGRRFDAIGFSTGMHKDGPSWNLIEELVEQGYAGQMIAASADPTYRQQQLQAGCQHALENKGRLIDKIVEVMSH